MKTMLMMILGLSSIQAMASEQDSLFYSKSNGSVAPPFAKRTTCSISTTSVTIVYSFAPMPVKKNITFTNEVPNLAVLQSLMTETTQFKTNFNPAPIGGGSEYYAAEFGVNNPVVLLQKYGTLVCSNNPSPTTPALIDFINVNCGVVTVGSTN